MPDGKEKAPYAPYDHVVGLIRRFRERGLPNVLDLEALVLAGVPRGNAPRVRFALRFLGLIDDYDQRTEAFDRLGQAPSERYPEQLAEIVRAAYAQVFTVIDPATATDLELANAFQQYEPRGQRRRMTALFRVLCQEAKLIEGRPPERRRSQRTPSPPGQQTTDHYRLLTSLLQQLPEERSWTQQQRDRWLRAFQGNLDLFIDVVD